MIDEYDNPFTYFNEIVTELIKFYFPELINSMEDLNKPELKNESQHDKIEK